MRAEEWHALGFTTGISALLHSLYYSHIQVPLTLTVEILNFNTLKLLKLMYHPHDSVGIWI